MSRSRRPKKVCPCRGCHYDRIDHAIGGIHGDNRHRLLAEVVDVEAGLAEVARTPAQDDEDEMWERYEWCTCEMCHGPTPLPGEHGDGWRYQIEPTRRAS